jgi:hypothetical protein
MSVESGKPGVPLASRLRPWLWAGAALLLVGTLVAATLGDGTTSRYAGILGAALAIGSLLNFFVGRSGRDELARAGAGHALPSWRASNGWTAVSFDVNRRDYDPDGSAWAELVNIARSHGYALARDQDPVGDAWHFVRASSPAPSSDIRER